MRKATYEAVSFTSDSCKAFLEEKEQFYASWHYHPEYELTYILRSKGIRYIGNTIENYEEDDLILIGPNVPHCWHNNVDPDFKALAVVVQWKENMIDSRWPEFDSISRFLKASGKGLRFTVPVALGFRERLINLTQLPPIEKFIQLLQILYELSRSTGVRALCEQDFIYNLDLNENERISKIYCYVKRHYQDKITLKDIASYVNISEEYFSRFFSKTMKKTFFAFLNEYRINIACQLLIETDMSVKEVCYHCGYESLPFFYRQFKKVKGCSPMEFRGRYV